MFNKFKSVWYRIKGEEISTYFSDEKIIVEYGNRTLIWYYYEETLLKLEFLVSNTLEILFIIHNLHSPNDLSNCLADNYISIKSCNGKKFMLAYGKAFNIAKYCYNNIGDIKSTFALFDSVYDNSPKLVSQDIFAALR